MIARFQRLSGREVFFLTGTDEHGQKVQESAAQRDMEPMEFCNEVSAVFQDLLTTLNISSDYFVRTTDAKHQDSVKVIRPRKLCRHLRFHFF